MQKIITRILFLLNGLMIFLLLFFSLLLLYLAMPGKIFGCSFLLQTSPSSSSSLLLLQKDSQIPAAGNKILIQASDGSFYLTKVDESRETGFSCLGPNGEELELIVSDEVYQGKILFQNETLGAFLAQISLPDNLPVTYIILSLSLFFSLLTLFCIYLLTEKRKSSKPETRAQEPEFIPVLTPSAAEAENIQEIDERAFKREEKSLVEESENPIERWERFSREPEPSDDVSLDEVFAKIEREFREMEANADREARFSAKK